MMGFSQNVGIVHEGDLANCFDKWFDDYPGATLSLLHMDVDLYTPTKLALDSLWDSLVPGGIIIFDEYGLPPGVKPMPGMTFVKNVVFRFVPEKFMVLLLRLLTLLRNSFL